MAWINLELKNYLDVDKAVFDFNHNKGLLFKEAAYKQVQNKAGAKETAKFLSLNDNKIYTSKVGDSGYATVSNSDISEGSENESGEEMLSITSKLKTLGHKV